MSVNPRILAIIPARGGSKRLPRKNTLPLNGKPLIAWTIEAALTASMIDCVVVSTDNEEIASISKERGAEVPFLRPPELATDTAGTLEVILHAIHSLPGYDYVVVLQPTSPLRIAEDIDKAIDLLLKKNADAVISVCETDHPPEWSNTLPDDFSLANFYRPGVRTIRSQDQPKSYRLNGAVYIYNCKRLLKQENLEMDDNSFAYIMPKERSTDIDTEFDFEIAQLFLTRFVQGNLK